jgi:hypothetical protein
MFAKARGTIISSEDGRWGTAFGNLTAAALPVQLASFTGTVLTNGNVRLNWMTLSELNNYGFEAQKSSGQLSGYVAIPNSFIPGHGTTIEPHYYSYTDATATPGRWWYRLKQIDLDGTIHYSDGIQVDIVTSVAEGPLPSRTALHQNYPNPFNPTTIIQYDLPVALGVKLEIFNALGQQVALLVDEKQSAGFHQVVFENHNLPSGVYFYTIEAGQFRASKKLVLLR